MIRFRRTLYIAPMSLIVLTVWFLIFRDKSNIRGILIWKYPDNDIFCHDVREEILRFIEDDDSSKDNSIYFHETTCRGYLNSRQACAVESAAKVHLDRDVYVLFNAPVTREVLKKSALVKLMQYSNIKLFRISLLKYAQGTPLAMLVTSPKLHNSLYLKEHTSDILRYITLFKRGGVYLDTDVVVVRSLEPLGRNWVGREDDTLANPAVIGISKDELGRTFVEEVMTEINNSYDPQIFNYNGPGAITRVLQRWCNSSDLETWNASKCGGFSVYDPEHFFPIDFEDYKKYFEPGEVKDAVKDVTKVYTYHLWNKLSSNTTVDKNSPYAKLAKKYCPEIYIMYSDNFGQ